MPVVRHRPIFLCSLQEQNRPAHQARGGSRRITGYRSSPEKLGSGVGTVMSSPSPPDDVGSGVGSGFGVDGAGVSGRGVDGLGVDGTGVSGRGVDGFGVDGAGVSGRGVGFTVGLAVGFAVGLVVGFAVGLAVGFAVSFGFSVGVGVSSGCGVSEGAGVPEAAGVSVGAGAAVGVSSGVGSGSAANSASSEVSRQPCAAFRLIFHHARVETHGRQCIVWIVVHRELSRRVARSGTARAQCENERSDPKVQSRFPSQV